MRQNKASFKLWKETKKITRSLNKEITKWRKDIIGKTEVKKFRTTPIQYMYLCFQDFSGICFRYEGELDLVIFNRVMENLIREKEFMRSQIIYENGAYWWNEYEMGSYSDIPVCDISNYDKQQQQYILESCIKNIYLRSYNIFYCLFYRAMILKESENSYVVILPFSHTIFDAVSSNIFQNELLQQYTSYMNGIEPKIKKESRYLEYLKQIEKGPVNITDDQLVKEFQLSKLYDLSKVVSGITQSCNDLKKTRFCFSVDLNVQEKYDCLIGYCMKYAYQLCKEILKIDEIPIFLTNIGRMYEMHMYDDILGAFVDFIPYILRENEDVSSLQNKVNELSMKRNVHNINFVKYIVNEKDEECYKKTAELLSDTYDNYRIIINFIGFLDNDEFEPIIYKYSNSRLVDTLLFSVRIIDGKFTVTTEISHYVEEKELNHIAQLYHYDVKEISYRR